MSSSRESREEKLARVVDDVLTSRDLHGLSPRVARDLQLAAAAVTHDRFRRLLAELAKLLDLDDLGPVQGDRDPI